MPSSWFAVGFRVAEGERASVVFHASLWERDTLTAAWKAADLEVRFFGLSAEFRVEQSRLQQSSRSWTVSLRLGKRSWTRYVRYPLAWLCRLMPMRCGAYSADGCSWCGWHAYEGTSGRWRNTPAISPVSAPPPETR